MTIIVFMAGISFGLYFLLAEALKIPYLKTSKAVMNMERQNKNLSTALEAVIMDLAVKLAKIIPMDEYKKNRLNATLKAAGVKMTAECYTAYAYVKAGMVLLGIIPCILVLPFLSIAIPPNAAAV